jgi:hypothetical protein
MNPSRDLRNRAEEIRKETIRQRRLQHQSAAAQAEPETEPEPPLRKRPLSPKNPDDGHTNIRAVGTRESLPTLRQQGRRRVE